MDGWIPNSIKFINCLPIVAISKPRNPNGFLVTHLPLDFSVDCHILSGEMSYQKVIHCHYSIVIIVIIVITVSTVSISIITIKNFEKNGTDEKSQKVRACCWPWHIPPKGLRRDSLDVRLCCNVVLSITGTAVLGISAQMKTFGWIFTPVVLVILGEVDGEVLSNISLTYV